MSLALATHPACLHCGKEISSSFQGDFCCPGCRAVFEFIQSQGLGQYYSIRKKIGDSGRPSAFSQEDFSYLDERDFLEAYSEATGKGQFRRMQLYLEGVHCSACVWVVEKLGSRIDGVRWIRLDLGNRVATIEAQAGSFGRAASEIAQLGYRPHPVSGGSEQKLLSAENRSLLARIAVAGACAGNIMLLAVSRYAGLDGSMAVVFDKISAGLFLPVLLYSAVPLFQGAWISLKQRSLSIDVPVILGISLGSLTSYFNLFSGNRDLYFDSLSALVFLLLSSRYLLRRAQQSSMSQSHLLQFITPSSARKLVNGELRIVRVDSLQPGDRIEVRAGETLPADGRIIRGAATIDLSLLTGEPRPEEFLEGGSVYAGTVNLSGAIQVEVSQSGYATRLGRILQSAEQSLANKAKILSFSDKVAEIFTLGLVVTVALVFAIRLHDGWNLALNQVLALSLVACPCAFALAAPLAMSMTIGRLAKDHILVKGSEALEKLVQVREIFLDKTGTLTEGHLEVESWDLNPGLSSDVAHEIEDAVLAIEDFSNHPVARALVRHFGKKAAARNEVTDFKEEFGKGVSGRFAGNDFQIIGDPKGSEIRVFRNASLVGTAVLKDRIRPDSKMVIERLNKLGLKIHILSGDAEQPVMEAASACGVGDAEFRKTPEEKAEILHKHSDPDHRAMMVGDGANDAAALASAYLGVAVHNGAEISLRTSDIYACDPGIRSVEKLIIAGRETIHVIHRNFAISLLYNLAATTGAIFGKIDPLFAAVLMPASAFTLFLSSIAGTRKLREIGKGTNL